MPYKYDKSHYFLSLLLQSKYLSYDLLNPVKMKKQQFLYLFVLLAYIFSGSAQEVLTPVNVTATAIDGANVPENLFDGDFSTRWSAFGNPQYATIDLGSVKRFNEVQIAYFKGNIRRAYFDLLRSDDGTDWTVIQTGFESSGTSLDLESFSFTEQEARYIRYVGNGNSASDWNSLNEMVIIGADTRPPRIIQPVGATATNVDGTNVPAHLIDGNLNTRWSSYGIDQMATLDLGSNQRFNELRIAYFKGAQRNAYFDLERSTDGNNWQTIATGFQSSGTTLDLESFTFLEQNARYIRYVGKGNSLNAWNSLLEIQVVGPSEGSTRRLIPISSTATVIDGPNVPAHLYDGNLGTRWSANAVGSTATMDLGSIMYVNELRIAFYKADQRNAYFDLQRSTDGNNWTTFQSGLSSDGVTTDLESFSFQQQAARYIRYVGQGNSTNAWNSILEIEIMGTDADEDDDTEKATSLIFLFDTAGNQIVRRPPEQATALKAKLPPELIAYTGGEDEQEPENPFERSISIYPNPTKGDLSVQWDGEHTDMLQKITVTDITGRAIPVRYDAENHQAMVDLRSYPTGLYLVTFHLSGDDTVTKKILKD